MTKLCISADPLNCLCIYANREYRAFRAPTARNPATVVREDVLFEGHHFEQGKSGS
jgi:hypothetical protein